MEEGKGSSKKGNLKFFFKTCYLGAHKVFSIMNKLVAVNLELNVLHMIGFQFYNDDVIHQLCFLFLLPFLRAPGLLLSPGLFWRLNLETKAVSCQP